MPDYLIAEMQRQRLHELDVATAPGGWLAVRLRHAREAGEAWQGRSS